MVVAGAGGWLAHTNSTNKETNTLSAEHPEVPGCHSAVWEIFIDSTVHARRLRSTQAVRAVASAESTGVPPPESFWQAELVENTKGHQQPASHGRNQQL